MITIAVRFWYVFVIAGLLAVIGVQQMRINHAHKEYAFLQAQIAEERAKASEAARLAEQEAREEEQRREQRRQEIIDEAEGRTELARAAADDAQRSADRLRERLDAFAAAIRRTAEDSGTAKPSQSKQDSASLDLLISVLHRASNGAGELAAYADRLHAAGLACEASYDGLRK